MSTRTTRTTVTLALAGTLGLAGGAGVVQWYDESPRPGDPGIAVIAGHVTTGGEPDAFFTLAEVETGTLVHVTTADGEELTYEVTEVHGADKDAVMTDPDVWGESDASRLALVTCDQASGVEGDGHFVDNLVVEAELVEDDAAR